MKRSHSSDEEDDHRTIVDNKKSRNEPVLPNDNYYVIRKSKSSSSTPTLDDLRSESKFKEADRRSTSSLFDKRDRFAPFDKKDRFHDRKDRSFEKPAFSSSTPSSFEKSSLKSKSTSSLSQPAETRSNAASTLSGYNVRFPAKTKLDDLVGQASQSDKRDSKSISSHYVMRSSDGIAQTNASLRDQFDTLVRSKNLDYRLEYITRLTVNGKSIESTACESAEKAERQILLTAIKELRDMQSAPVVDETMNEEVIESEIVQEIKQILKRQENNLLFKDEIPLEYQKRFKRKIPGDWFDRLSSESGSFKIERHGSGNLVSIKLA